MIRPSSSGHSECSERSIQNVKLCHKGQICIPHAAAAAVNDDINNDDDVNNDYDVNNDDNVHNDDNDNEKNSLPRIKLV